MNSKKKKILIISGVIFVLIVILVNIFLPDNDTESEPTLISQEAPDSYFSTENYPEVETPKTETVKAGGSIVKNFYIDENKVSPKGDVIIAETSSYTIFYFKNDDSFLLSITASPFEENRLLVEKDFLQQLEIDEDKACKLNTATTTPAFVNPDEAGKNWPLTFCEE